MDYTTSPHGQKAKALFLEGYNCSQAIAMAFREELEQKGFPMQATLAMVGSMGGGMGRLREVCGTVRRHLFGGRGPCTATATPRTNRPKRSTTPASSSWRPGSRRSTARTPLSAGNCWA